MSVVRYVNFVLLGYLRKSQFYGRPHAKVALLPGRGGGGGEGG